MIYTVTFNPAIDYRIDLTSFSSGGINRAQEEQISFGGKGINVSAALCGLGMESTAIGFLAGFTGEEIEKRVKNLGIKTGFIHLTSGFSRINVKIRAGEETEINGRGPEIPKEALSELFAKTDALLPGDTLILAGSVPKTLPENIYEQILSRLAGKEIRFVVDAEKNLLLNVLSYRPFLIKPNEKELGALFGKEFESPKEIEFHAKKLKSLGARNVLVSMGENGALLAAEDEKIYRIGIAKGRVCSTVGAGDSMVAGFLAGYLQTGDYAYALKLGTAAAGATAFSAGIAGKEEIFKVLKSL